MTKAERKRLALSFPVGSRVRIARVRFPEISYHAKFVGYAGQVIGHIKTQGIVKVQTEIGQRHCHAENLERL
jgi:hypothetical protein